MGVLSFISEIFKPAADIVDNLNTSEEERLELRNALAKIEAGVLIKQLELQASLAESTAKVAAAEAGSDSWLTRNYRPFIIISMFGMIVGESFGLLKTELPEVFWQIFAAAFGVMSVGPSILKTGTELIKKVFKK
jgi:hypothetical protein